MCCVLARCCSTDPYQKIVETPPVFEKCTFRRTWLGMLTHFRFNLLIQISSQDTFVSIFIPSRATASPGGPFDSHGAGGPAGIRTVPVGLVAAAFWRREQIVTG